MSEMRYIATLDVGTTTLRCHIINSNLNVISTATTEVTLIYPQPGFVEINPDELWEAVQRVIKKAIGGNLFNSYYLLSYLFVCLDAGLQPCDISCLAISTQRSTFITWQRNNGKPFHNFITWKDMRSKSLVKSWNNSFTMNVFRKLGYLIYCFTRNRRYLMASELNFSTIQCSCRLLWVLENIPAVAENLRRRNVCFGTLDTWLIYKLSGFRLFVSDVANASSTGLYDPFIMEWSTWPRELFGISLDIYPNVVSTDYDFGNTAYDIFDASIPLKCMTADQQASMFASWYLSQNDIKVTLGTGTFIDLNTKNEAHASVGGIYPLVAWKLENKITYMAEAACNDTGSLIQWLLSIGLINTPEETSSLAQEVENSDGVYFVPAFSGLGPPISDDMAASGFFGVKPTSTKAHLVRATLESIVYRIILSLNVLKSERNESYKKICVDGGVSNNDFVCQMLANMSGLEVIRFRTHDLSVIGATLIAGINAGIWNNNENPIKTFNKETTIFEPNIKESLRKELHANLDDWLKVVKRFKSWYLK
nr:putative glycerol kinase 5 isoform X1 [Onthophagus taurus]XP_022900487.1 putative glycerol kinase 5 isoform X1 [Onthophagus taurus]